MESSKRSAAELAADLLGSVDLTFSPQPVIPGDNVTSVVTRKSKRLRIGSGLIHESGSVIATQLGTLRYAAPSTYWVESRSQKRYVPQVEDGVIGIVEDRGTNG